MRYRLVSFFVLVAAGLILWVAVPRVALDFLLDPYSNALAPAVEGEPPTLLPAIKGRERLRPWTQNAGDEMKLAKLYLAAAFEEPLDSIGRRVRLEQSRKAYERAVVLDPGRPFAWARLTEVLIDLDDPDQPPSATLTRAIRAAPYHARLGPRRIRLGRHAWVRLDEETRNLVAEQLRLAAALYPEETTRRLSRPADRLFISWLLIDQPLLWCRIDAAYRRLVPGEAC